MEGNIVSKLTGEQASSRIVSTHTRVDQIAQDTVCLIRILAVIQCLLCSGHLVSQWRSKIQLTIYFWCELQYVYRMQTLDWNDPFFVISERAFVLLMRRVQSWHSPLWSQTSIDWPVYLWLIRADKNKWVAGKIRANWSEEDEKLSNHISWTEKTDNSDVRILQHWSNTLTTMLTF